MQVAALEWYKDRAGGCLMVAIGLGVVLLGKDYPLGALDEIGPGFFPLLLGVLLSVVGLAILATARPAASRDGERFTPEWRGWLCIALSLVLFVVLGEHGGLLPATFAVVFVSALADRRNGLKEALLLALASLAVCVVVFWWALQLQFPLLRWG